MITAESLKSANEALNTIGIEKGKKKTNYVMVNERVKAFRSICPSGCITTQILSLGDGVVTMLAEVKDEHGNLIASGMAQEKETASFINQTSFIENCETSAVGRALGFAGIGIDGSMASAEEVANAIMQQNTYPSREEMLAIIEKKYPPNTKNRQDLFRMFGIKDVIELSDARVKAVYNKCMEQRK